MAGCLEAASNPWDGLWFNDSAQSRSRIIPTSCRSCRMECATTTTEPPCFLLLPTADPTPSFPANFSFTVTRMNDRTLDYVEMGHSRVLEPHHHELSDDGKKLTGSVTRIYPDGREVERGIVAVRVVSADELEGTLKELAAPSPDSVHRLGPDALSILGHLYHVPGRHELVYTGHWRTHSGEGRRSLKAYYGSPAT